jgi:hypothetical protein
MFLRIRKSRASLVKTYRQGGKVKHQHLWSLHPPSRSKRSFTMDILHAKQLFDLRGAAWESILAKAGPHLDWDEFGQHLRGEVAYHFPNADGGPMITLIDRSVDYAFDL